jgi:hypothetical protein
LQNELDVNYPELDIQILGLNEVGHESGNPLAIADRDLPWLQDLDSNGDDLSDVWYNSWNITYRDVVVVDANNVEVGRFNVTQNDLAIEENYNTLRQMLLDAATNSSPATGRFDTSLVVEPTPTASNGEVDALPGDVDFIHEWQPFSLEIWVSTPETDSFAVASASAVVDYNTDFFTADPTIEYGPAFTIGQASSVDDVAGRITVAAATEQTDVGDDNWVLLARFHFQATGDDPGVSIDLTEPVPVAPVDETWIALADDAAMTVDLVDLGTVDVDMGPTPTTALYPMLYDLDDDGRISFGDLAIFASAFLARVDDMPRAAKCDFDISDRVSFGDLAFLAANFLMTRETSGSIVFPDNFPEDFGPQALAVNSVSSPQGEGLPVTGDQLAPIVDEAVARMRSSTHAAGTTTLDTVTFDVVDLPGDLLGRATGSTVEIDVDAAGHGWFVDATPDDNREFSTRSGEMELTAPVGVEAAGRVDLLTVVMHELGHVLGAEHTESSTLMDAALPPGTRRMTDEIVDLRPLDTNQVDDFFASLDD